MAPAASPASASLVLLKSRLLAANKDNKMNSVAFSLASQIGFSRRHFFVVNGLAFPLSNSSGESDSETPDMARISSMAILAGTCALTRAQPKREKRRTH